MQKTISETNFKEFQRKIVIDFLNDIFVEFELTGSPLVKLGEPTRRTFKEIIRRFKLKEHVPIDKNEVARFCFEMNALYEEYKTYSQTNSFTLPLLSRQQFSRTINQLMFEKDGREFYTFRFSRKQIKYVFPLLKRL